MDKEKSAARSEKPDHDETHGQCSKNKVSVTVKYLGQEDFVSEFPAGETFKGILIASMQEFDLDVSQSKRYVLQYEGADLPDSGHLRDVGKDSVVLCLRLKEEVQKG